MSLPAFSCLLKTSKKKQRYTINVFLPQEDSKNGLLVVVAPGDQKISIIVDYVGKKVQFLILASMIFRKKVLLVFVSPVPPENYMIRSNNFIGNPSVLCYGHLVT